MNKRLLIFVLCLGANLLALAYDVEINGIFYNLNNSTRTATVTQKDYFNTSAYAGHVVIPEQITHNGVQYTVTEIGEWALRYSDVESVVIPTTITKIGERAFEGCHSLTKMYYNAVKCTVNSYWLNPLNLHEVIFGEDVQSVPSGLFANAGKLKVVRFNAKNCRGGSMSSALGYNGSTGNWSTHIDSMFIGDSVLYIPSNLCYQMDSLHYVRMGQSVRVIGEYAFRACPRLTELELPPMLDSIMTGGLQALRGIKELHIPRSLRYVGLIGFSSTDSIRIHVEDLAAYAAITCEHDEASPLYNNYLYVGGQRVTDLVLPDTARTVGKYAFSGCLGLNSVTLSDSLRTIEEGGFYHLPNVQTIRLPEACEKVGKMAFYDCDSMRTIISDAVTPPQLEAQCFYRWFKYNYTGLYSRYNVLIGCSVDSLAYAANSSWAGYKFRKERPQVSVATAEGGMATGEGKYACDEWVTITAVADEGYTFVGWSDGDQTNPRLIQVDGDVTYEPLFAGSNPTDIHTEPSQAIKKAEKLMIDNHLYIRRQDGETYTIDGMHVIRL